MNKAELLQKLEELIGNEDLLATAPKVKTLQKEYEKLFSEEADKARQEFIDDGGKAKEFTFAKSPEDAAIVDLFEKFRKHKKSHDDKIANEQNQNLLVKQEIIHELNSLSKLDVNVGTAIKKMRDLQAKWKESGSVSPHKYKEIQGEYSKAVENFNYNLNIYSALQDHDRKKNQEHKIELIGKLKALSENTNIKEVENLIKIYRNEWDEVGPVIQENWEDLKNQYRTALEDV